MRQPVTHLLIRGMAGKTDYPKAYSELALEVTKLKQAIASTTYVNFKTNKQKDLSITHNRFDVTINFHVHVESRCSADYLLEREAVGLVIVLPFISCALKP